MTKKDDGSWAVDYSEQDQVFTITVLEYHAEPLKLPLAELLKMAGPAAEASAAPTVQEPRVGISRKEKSLYIAVPEGWAGVLKISRKELYQFGKMMGRRGRART